MKLLFLIAGRSNAGKSTLTRYFQTMLQNPVRISVIGDYRIGKQYTTRSPRDGELVGADALYHYVDDTYLQEHRDDIIAIQYYKAAYGDVSYAVLNNEELWWESSRAYGMVDLEKDFHTEGSCIPVTILDCQIDMYPAIYRWVFKHNTDHPNDPYLAVCLYLYASTDTLLARAYQRELGFSEEKQNWKEIVRRMVSETTSPVGMNLHALIHKLITEQIADRHRYDDTSIAKGGIHIFPKHITETFDENGVPTLSVVEDSPWFCVDSLLPPFFYIQVDQFHPDAVGKYASALINYLLNECANARTTDRNFSNDSNGEDRSTNTNQRTVLYSICDQFSNSKAEPNFCMRYK